ncbi:MAG: histidine phosphatase family protein [Tessaracoccus sp.]
MRLILIRHGQTQSNVNLELDTAYPGAPLNNIGLAQANSLVERIAHEPIEALYASTLTHAQQTAAPLATARGLTVNVLDGIQEIAAGVDEMSTNWKPYIDMLTSWSPTNLDVGMEGGETARQFVARYTRAIAQIEAAGHQRAALVSHGAALRVWALTCVPTIDQSIALPLQNTHWIVMNGSLSDGWTIEQWGEHRF